jgi:hypothetical protein
MLSTRPPRRRIVHSGLPTWLSLPLCVVFSVSSAAWAAEALPNKVLDAQSVVAPGAGPILLAPFKYIPTVTVTSKPDANAPKRSAGQQRILDLSAAGDYQTIAKEGVTLLAGDNPDDELRLIFANSLAWTGRLQAAVAAYSVMTNGKYANEATLGMASVNRWMGRDDLALPLYKAVLDRDSSNDAALEGLEMVTRELKPKTSISIGGAADSSNMERKSATVSHRWRDKGGTVIMEVETMGVRDTLPTSQTEQQDVTLRYQDVGLALKPSLEISLPGTTTRTTYGVDNRALYGSVKFSFDNDQETLQIGSVNWGKMATNAYALAANLSATHLGLTASRNFSAGNVLARVDYYDISDGNSITSGRLYLNSAWRPLGNTFKPFLSVESRKAKFSAFNYWSPAQGAGALYAGMLGDWGAAEWNIFLSGQYGVGLWGDAGNGWGVSTGGKRWLSSDVALSLNLWAMSTWRDNSNYKAQAASMTLEKLWR